MKRLNVLGVLSDHEDIIRTYNLDLDKGGNFQTNESHIGASPLITGPPEEETKSALEVLSENGALVEEAKVAMDLKTLIPPPLPPPLDILSGPSTRPTTYTESPTLIREAKQIQELLSEYKEDSRNIQRQVNRLAELLEMSGLQASFNSNNVTLPAPSLRSDTPVRPGLMMLESTPGPIKGQQLPHTIARSACHLAGMIMQDH